MPANMPIDYLARRSKFVKSSEISALASGELKDMIAELQELIVPEMQEEAAELAQRVQSFAVRVSLIGQVKAGKTALCNAMMGINELLPSDINPWTSVVTSVHLNQAPERQNRAVFTFFTEEEWERMVDTGGRVAALAHQADFDTEVDEVRSQIAAMQERTKERLGKNFTILLGNQHSFSEFNPDLVKRYVCLGDEDAEGDPEGRFASMTRSAELYLDTPLFGYPATLVDTPGVNDPFLVREAVTLDSLGKSDICVIVLSAHQALSTSDLALMRILLGLKHEQIVLFINRIDELSDPVAQIPEIRERIKETLVEQQLPVSLPVLFGSAEWAAAGVKGDLDDISDASTEALQSLVAAEDSEISDLSGISALQDVLDQKARDEVGGPFVAETATRAADLARRSKALLSSTTQTAPRSESFSISADSLVEDISILRSQLTERLYEIKLESDKHVLQEISGTFQRFVFFESRSLNSHMEGRGRVEDWAADTDGLRRNLNDIYRKRSEEMYADIKDLYDTTYKFFAEIYDQFGDEDGASLGLSPPRLDKPGTPISLMRTMTVDLSTSWLVGWIARRLKRDTYLKKFRTITLEQLRATSVEVREEHVAKYCDEALQNLMSYIDSHAFAVEELARLQDQGGRVAFLRKMEQTDNIEARIDGLEDLIDRLEIVSAKGRFSEKNMKKESA